MPENYPGPFEVELIYTAGGDVHTARLNCNTGTGVPAVGTSPASINLLCADGTNKVLQTAVAEYGSLIANWLSTGDSVDSFDFYAYPTPNGARQYVTSGILNISGTHANPAVLAHQQTFTFKTGEGNTMRTVLLETVIDGNVREAYSILTVPEQTYMDYVSADETWIMARDTSYPIVPLAMTGGQNEALFKKRYR